MEITASRSTRAALRIFFAALVLFLYAPLLILILFSFNKSSVPTFPLAGFTLHWYRAALSNITLLGSLRTSAYVAGGSSVIAVAIAIPTAMALGRRNFRLKGLVSTIVLVPLVIPYVVLGVSLLTFFEAVHIPLSVVTVLIAHVVLQIPYAVLVILPRVQGIQSHLEEAAHDLGAGAWHTFRLVLAPLLAPAIVSALLITFTLSFDEYVVASFVIGSGVTFPIYLFSLLRFFMSLPQGIAVASVIVAGSFVIGVIAEAGRVVSERRLVGRPTRPG